MLGFPFSMGEKITKAMPPAVMGKDVPLSGIFDPEHKRYDEAGEFRALHAEDPEVAKVVETARGLENLKRQWGVHAAGVIMSSEPLLDLIPIMRREQDGQVITQFDYPTCETLGLVKMDFLGLRNLTILDDALKNVQANRGVEVDLDALTKDPTDDDHLRAARARRHPRGVPVRRRADAPAAAADEARQLRGHLRRRRALPSRPDGCGLAHQLRAAQERAAGGRVPAPRAGRGARTHPRHHLRPDRVPGAGHGDRPEAGRVHPRQGRPAAPGDGQEEARGPRRRVRRLRGRHARRTASARPRSRRCGTSSSRSPTTPSTRRTPPRTAWSRTGRPTSRPTTRPSTWPPCSPASATTRTSPPSTWPSAAGWASRSCRRT